MDLLYAGIALLFFLVSKAFVRLCEKL